MSYWILSVQFLINNIIKIRWWVVPSPLYLPTWEIERWGSLSSPTESCVTFAELCFIAPNLFQRFSARQAHRVCMLNQSLFIQPHLGQQGIRSLWYLHSISFLWWYCICKHNVIIILWLLQLIRHVMSSVCQLYWSQSNLHYAELCCLNQCRISLSCGVLEWDSEGCFSILTLCTVWARHVQSPACFSLWLKHTFTNCTPTQSQGVTHIFCIRSLLCGLELVALPFKIIIVTIKIKVL